MVFDNNCFQISFLSENENLVKITADFFLMQKSENSIT